MRRNRAEAAKANLGERRLSVLADDERVKVAAYMLRLLREDQELILDEEQESSVIDALADAAEEHGASPDEVQTALERWDSELAPVGPDGPEAARLYEIPDMTNMPIVIWRSADTLERTSS